MFFIEVMNATGECNSSGVGQHFSCKFPPLDTTIPEIHAAIDAGNKTIRLPLYFFQNLEEVSPFESNVIEVSYYKDISLTSIFPSRIYSDDWTMFTLEADGLNNVNKSSIVCNYCLKNRCSNNSVIPGGSFSAVVCTAGHIHCPTPKWDDIKNSSHSLYLSVSLGLNSYSNSLKANFAPAPLLILSQWILIGLLMLIFVIIDVWVYCCLSNKNSSDGYQRISRGNINVDISDIQLLELAGKGNFA